MKKILFYVLMIASITFESCKKIVEVDTPKNQLTTDNVFKDSVSAEAAILNIYASMDKAQDISLNKSLGLYTDELMFSGSAGPTTEMYQSRLFSGNATNLLNWTNFYSAIYQCNDILEHTRNNLDLSSTMLKTLTGEAKFLRALNYFYLVNMYQHVPLVMSTALNENAEVAQSTQEVVYSQMISDLKDAQSLLLESYRGPGKTRANKWAATALLARVYLYQKDYINAETEASKVINSGLYSPLDALSNVFLATSKEAILQIWTQNGFIADATSLIPNVSAPAYPVTTWLLNAFESGDMRKTSWIKTTTVGSGTNAKVYYSLYKYKNRTINTAQPEYLMILRLSEQYLIRGEARINQTGKLADGIADINVVRNRARAAVTAAVPNPLPALMLNLSQADALIAVKQERRVEMFCEWGHRFMDLKRTGEIDAYMKNIKTAWKTGVAENFPIPQTEITYDHNLIQNTGY